MTSTKFQQDADIVRLQHLQYYAELIESYHQKMGKYPFQKVIPVPLYIHVANNEQIEFTKQALPLAHETAPFKLLVHELEKGLGYEIDEYFDPQYRPDYKPNFYVYMVTKDTYFFAIHVHQSYPFARQIDDHYYKIEISNKPNVQNKALSPEKLFTSAEFKEAILKPISKEDFFKEREAKYLHYSKIAK